MSLQKSILYLSIAIITLVFSICPAAQEYKKPAHKLPVISISDDFERVHLNDAWLYQDALTCGNSEVSRFAVGGYPEITSGIFSELNNDLQEGDYKQCLIHFSISSAFVNKQNKELVLSVSNPILRHIETVVVTQSNQIIARDSFGLLDEQKKSPGHGSKQAIEFTLDKNQTLNVFVLVRSSSEPVMLIDLFAKDAYQSYHQVELILWGATIALLLGGAFYNTFIYLVSRSSSYVWYLVFYSLVFVYFSAFHGFGSLLWPEKVYQWLGQQILPMSFLLNWVLLQFAIGFLKGKKYAYSLVKYRRLIDFILITFFILSVMPFNVSELMLGLLILQFSVFIYCLTIAILAWKKGFYPARFFILSWSFLVVGALISLSARVGLLPVNVLTFHAFFIGSIAELMLMSIALADRLKYAEHLSFKYAFTDPRTLQPNLPFLRSRNFQTTLSEDGAFKPSTVLLLKLEGLEKLSSFLGPHQTELLYRQLVNRIEEFLSRQPAVIRYPDPHNKSNYMVSLPDDILLILLREGNVQEEICRSLIKIAESPLETKGVGSSMSSRIGVASVELIVNAENKKQNLRAIFESYRRALVALQSDKSQKITTYSESQDKKIGYQVALLSDLQLAVENKAFSIYIQPQFDITGKTLIGGEVLVRWVDETRGFVSPADFIPLAEQTGNIYPITRVILEKSMKWLGKHRDAFGKFVLAINLSVHDIYQKELVPYIQSQLELNDLSPDVLMFEITESAMSENQEAFLAGVAKLKSLGVSVALDDFGTGYSSMSYLQRIAADKIKIDISFVRDIHESPINRGIVASIITVAKAIGATTLAEGIECEEELAVLEAMNVEFVQGYLTGRPTPAEHFIDSFCLNREGSACQLRSST